MRIGIDIGKLAVRLDGVGRYCAGVLHGLAEIERGLPAERGNRYLLYSLLADPTESSWPEWLRRLGDRFEVTGRSSPAPGEVDLFHCTAHAVPDDPNVGPLLFSLYDLTFLTLPRLHTLDNRLQCTVGLSRALARGGKLAAISEHTRRDAERLLGLATGTVAVVPPGIDPRFEARDPVEARATAARLGLTGDYIFHLGVEEPRKNTLALVEAYRSLPPELRQRYTLALGGHPGWGGAQAVADAARDAPGEVRRLGSLSDEELPALYAAASLFVFPSLYEGFGLPPLEAMACGAPTLVSSVSSLPEVVGEAAELCDPEPAAIAAAMERVLRDPAHQVELRRRGPLQAKRFRWIESARLLRVVYEQTVEGV
jgi:glycosyltransferase involved in cell wall biosynthesis